MMMVCKLYNGGMGGILCGWEIFKRTSMTNGTNDKYRELIKRITFTEMFEGDVIFSEDNYKLSCVPSGIIRELICFYKELMRVLRLVANAAQPNALNIQPSGVKSDLL